MIFQNLNTKQTVIGAFLGGKSLLAGRVQNGKISGKQDKIINNLGTEKEILMELIEAISEFFDDEVTGIGVGVPSLVNIQEGIIYRTANIPSWKNVHLKEILEDRFKVNVVLNNDANCFTLGEKYFGEAINYSNIVGLIIGVGFGCGIVINNQLYSGNNCGAGEFGAIPYRESNFQYYCSEGYFNEKYGGEFTDFLDRAQNEDKVALAILEQYGSDLGNAIKTILFTIDPEIIVIGGRLSKAFSYFSKSMWDNVKTFPHKKSIMKLKIVVSTNDDIAIYGAAALNFDARKKFNKRL